MQYKKLFLLIIIFNIFSCDEQKITAVSIKPVYYYKVPKPEDSRKRTFTGALQAVSSSTMTFETQGRVVMLDAIAGKNFEKGEVLAKLDCIKQNAELIKSQSAYKRSVQDLNRKQALFETGNTSKEELENAIDTRTQSKARLDISNKEASECLLVMPYDGVVSSVYIDLQESVQDGTKAMEVVGQEGMEMIIGVPETFIKYLHIGLQASISLDAIAEKKFEGSVTEISQDLTSGGTYDVTIFVKNKNSDIRSGMSGTAAVSIANLQDVIIIPFESIVGSVNNQHYVWIFKEQDKTSNGTVQKRDVKIGEILSSGFVEVIDGLTAQEIIITKGVHQISEGLEVRLIKEDQ